MKKLCKKKCKKCKGVKCSNYGKIYVDYDNYYEGILHSKDIHFDSNETKKWSELYKNNLLKLGGFLE